MELAYFIMQKRGNPCGATSKKKIINLLFYFPGFIDSGFRLVLTYSSYPRYFLATA